MAIEPIKGFYLHDVETDTDGVAKYDAGALENLDRSLTERYRAPDSKAVGDRFSAVEAVADEANEIAKRLNEGGLELKDEVIGENVADWMDTHPEASTTVLDGSLTTAKYKDGSVTPAKMANFSTGYKSNAGIVEQLNTLDSKIVYITPMDFEGTDDTTKLQAAFDALATTGGVIVIDKEYVLDNNIIVRHNSGLNNRIFVLGLGVESVLNLKEYSFIGAENSLLNGGIYFENVTLVGTLYAFNLSHLGRIFMISCVLAGFTHLCYTDTYRAQSIYCNNCTIRNISSYIIRSNTATYDISIINNHIEWCGDICYMRGVTFGVNINENLIEGLTGSNIYNVGGIVIGFNANYNYMEDNGEYIILENLTSTQSAYPKMNFIGNTFLGRNTGAGFVNIKQNIPYGSITIKDNASSLTNDYLVKISDSVNNLDAVNVANNTGTIQDSNNVLPVNKETNADNLPNTYSRHGTATSPAKFPVTSSYMAGIVIFALQGAGAGVCAISRANSTTFTLTDIAGVSGASNLTATYDATNAECRITANNAFDITVMYRYLP